MRKLINWLKRIAGPAEYEFDGSTYSYRRLT